MSTTIDLSLLTRLDQEKLAAAGEGTLLRELLNLLEQLVTENQVQRDENQRLRDAINRLKGEQAKPTLRQAQGRLCKPKGPPAPGANDYSSEQARRAPKTWQQGRKLDRIKIDRVERRPVDPATLPDDAVSKGIEIVTVQDLILRTDNVPFELELWYSPSLRRSDRAPLPAGYEGEFGPAIKTLALELTYGGQHRSGQAAGGVPARRGADVQWVAGDVPERGPGRPGGRSAGRGASWAGRLRLGAQRHDGHAGWRSGLVVPRAGQSAVHRVPHPADAKLALERSEGTDWLSWPSWAAVGR